uniref:Uncharacterized protein n=1 Tax=Magallana gigas TaxID=29159 RepID=A0A8W8HZ21_MAGGI
MTEIQRHVNSAISYAFRSVTAVNNTPLASSHNRLLVLVSICEWKQDDFKESVSCVVVFGYLCCDPDHELAGSRTECHPALCVLTTKTNDKESTGDAGGTRRRWKILFNGTTGCCLFLFL